MSAVQAEGLESGAAVEDNGLTGGRQLLGTLASWFPRVFWPDKPDHTGRLILENAIYRVADTHYDNISAPVYMEVMIDFGWLGLIVFAILLGFLSSKFDVLFLEIRREMANKAHPKASAYPLIYTVMAPLPALSFLFWRGSWMPAVGYLVGTAVCGIGYSLLITRRIPPPPVPWAPSRIASKAGEPKGPR